MAERANLRLQLANRPENVMLVRQALTGVAEALTLDDSDLIDIHTAVTEACNNVVQHAYAGDEGPLEVVVELALNTVTVVVRDWGMGLPAHGGRAHEIGPGIGLTAIHALTHRLDLRRPADGGTEVSMEFATLGAHPPRLLAVPEAALPEVAPTARTPIALTVMPGDLARTVLPRLMCGLAARAHFSIDRLSDMHLIADALGTGDGAARLRIVAGVEPRALELRVGPLERGRGQRLVAADSSLDGVGSVIAKLVDRHHVESSGSYEVLALRLTDDRGRVRDADAARR